jgi:hypothetical protein
MHLPSSSDPHAVAQEGYHAGVQAWDYTTRVWKACDAAPCPIGSSGEPQPGATMSF